MTFYRDDIQILRGLSVLGVILYHINPSILPGGFLGVDFFFVISGFLISQKITRQIDANQFSLVDFYKRRYLRLFPALLATVLLVLIFNAISPKPFSANELYSSALAASLGVSNIYFNYTMDYFSPAVMQTPLLHTWSLGVEEQFYLVWPVLLIFINRKKASQKKILYFVSCVFFLSFLLGSFYGESAPRLVFYSIFFRAFEFLLGFIASLFVINIPRKSISFIRAPLFLILIATFYLSNETLSQFSLINSCGLICLFLLLVIPPAGKTYYFFEKLLVRIGDVSYSAYLIHWPIVCYLNYTLVGRDFLNILIASLCIVSATLFVYHIFEKPFREKNILKKKDSIRERKKLYLITSVLFATVVCSSGLAKYFTSLDWSRSASFLCSMKSKNCTIGALDGKKVLYLVGDSHIGNLVHGFDIFLKKNAIKGKVRSLPGCLLLPNSSLHEAIRGKKSVAMDCQRHVADTYGELTMNHSPVIIANNYAGYSRFNGYVLTPDMQRLYLESGLEKSLKILSLRKRKILLLLHNYNVGATTVPCYQSSLSFFKKCEPKFDGVRFKGINDLLIRVASKYPNVEVLDPKKAFCLEGKCNILSENAELYYIDEHHYSKEGSSHFLNYFENRFANFIKKSF